MNETWTVVALVGVGTMAMKAAGPVALGGRELPPRLYELVGALAPALLAALVATQVFDGGRELVVDERAAGVAAAAACLAARVPLVGTVIVAAAVTAALRAL